MILYGASGHCRVVVDIVEALGLPIDFIVDDNPEVRELLGYEVRRNTGIYDDAIITIGKNWIRKDICELIKVNRYITAVHPTAIVSPRVRIGEGSVVMQGAIIQSCAEIGKHCIVNTGASVVVAFGAKTTLKAIIKEERPDHSDNKSFPSGHAAIAFAAARSIDKEFRKDCIWIPIAGYAAATAIGIERVASDRHHWYDVVAGAGVGFGAAELTWWLSDLCFGKGSNIAVGSSGNTVDVTYNF